MQPFRIQIDGRAYWRNSRYVRGPGVPRANKFEVRVELRACANSVRVTIAIALAATARVINVSILMALARSRAAKASKSITERNDAHERVLHARNAENAITSDTVQAFPMASRSFARSGRRMFTTNADYQLRSAPPTGPASNISRRKVRANSLAAIPGNPIRGNDLTPRVTRDIVRSRLLPEAERRRSGSPIAIARRNTLAIGHGNRASCSAFP